MTKLSSMALSLIAVVTHAAHADCSFDLAGQLTQQLINQAAQSDDGYSYSDLKLAESCDEVTHITEVLFTYSAQVPNEAPSSQTMIGYAHYDASCNSVDSLITVAGDVNN